MSTSRSPEGLGPESALDLREYLRPIWRRRWLVIAIAVVAAGGTFAIAKLHHRSARPSSYTSQTKVLLQVAYAQEMVGSQSSAADNPPDQTQVEDQSQLVQGQADTDQVYKQLKMKVGSAGTVAAAPDTAGAAAYDGSDIIVITATSSTPQLSQRLANTYASVYLASRAQQYRSTARQEAGSTQTQLNSLADDSGNASQRQQLGIQLDTLRTEAGYSNASAAYASQVATANLGAPVATSIGRSPAVDAAIAAVVGLLLGIAIAYGVSMFDRRLLRISAVASGYGAEVLAVLPHVARSVPAESGHPVIPGELIETLRALRVTLQLGGDRTRARTLLVTSALPGEGKSTLARNLALVYVDGGERVLLIDADLRRPSVRTMFAINAERGLTHVLQGALSPGDAVVHVIAPPVTPSSNGHGRPTNAFDVPIVAQPSGTLDVLTHGDIHENPVPLLSSPGMETLLTSAREHYDVVIVDSAPILAVTDTVPLLSIVDSVLLVARLGVTTRDAAERLAETLRRVPDMNLAGVVANDLRDTFLDSGGYGGMYSARYGGYGYRAGGREMAGKVG